MNRAKWIVLAVAAVLVVAAAAILSSGPLQPGLIKNGDVGPLRAEGARIVDVRTAAEFTGAHLEGAENVPLSEIASAAAGWDRSVPVVLYCTVGDRSDSAAEILASMGFERVYDLGDGIVQWDGALAGGAGSAVAATSIETSGLPVMYEFYTDW
ncbi:MAG: Rhodanese-like protein [Actinobacteria bacterium 66_15]|nr:MAG: Rhodanese-like protein [Actinobacteria bacterium 66_15]